MNPEIAVDRLQSYLRWNASRIDALDVAHEVALEGDEKGALEALKRASEWALDIAEKIDVGVATQAIKTVIGV